MLQQRHQNFFKFLVSMVLRSENSMKKNLILTADTVERISEHGGLRGRHYEVGLVC